MKILNYLFVLICVLLCFSCSVSDVDTNHFNEKEQYIMDSDEDEDEVFVDKSKVTKTIYYAYDEEKSELKISLKEDDEFCNQTTFANLSNVRGKLGYINTITFMKGDDMFYPDTLHKAFMIPDLVHIKGFENIDTSYVKDFSYCFYENDWFDESILNYLKTDSGEDFSYMFYGTKGITYFDAAKYNLSRAKNFNSMFNRSSIEYADFSNGNYKNVVSMHYMFGASHLNSINFSNSNFSNCEDLFALFSGCTSLKEVNFENAVFNKVINMDYMFHRCRSLITIDISSFDLSNFNGISDGMDMNHEHFSFCGGCKELKSIYFPTTFEKKHLDNKYFYYECPSLVNIYYKKDNGDLKSIIKIKE